MSKEVFKNMEDLPKRSRWSGSVKHFTDECLDCDGYFELSDGEVCLKGVAWKQLTRENVRNTCSLKKRGDKENKAVLAPKLPIIIFTPSFEDFCDGTLDVLTAMGFKTRLVRKEDAEDKSGFSIKFE